MKGYGTACTVLLLWVSCSLASPVQNGGPQKCAAHCSGGTNNFAYSKGKSYDYKYTIETATTMEGTTNDKSEMSINAFVSVIVIDECEMELKIQSISLSDKNVNIDEWARNIKQHHLRFGFNDGEISDVCPEEDDSSLAVNFKKGILSQLQNTMHDLKQGIKTKETDINGECTVTYTVVEEDKITKEKDIMSCDDPIQVHTFMRSIPFDSNSPNQHLPLMKGTQSCVQTISNGVINSVCDEKFVLRPFSTDTAGAITTVKSTLSLTSTGTPAEDAHEDIVRREDLRLVSAHTEDQHSKEGALEEAKGVMDNLCDTVGGAVKKETPYLFIELVHEMTHLSEADLGQFQAHSEKACGEHSKQFFKDGLLMTKTGPAFALMAQHIDDGKVQFMRTDAWLSTLSFLEHPHLDMISGVLPLMDNPDISKKATLAVGSLVFSYCKTHDNCNEESEIADYLSAVDGKINNCQEEYWDDNIRLREILVALRGIGNAGLEVPSLSACIHDTAVPTEIRVAAMQAYRQMPCKAKSDKVYKMMKDIETDPELRIAAYSMVVKCPCHMCVNHINDLLEKEKSDQVLTYVVSHLKTTLASDSPLHIGVNKILSKIDITKKVDEIRGYSRFFDASSYNEKYNLGADVEGSLVYSPESFLPRSGNLNLTIELFGRAVNLFEVGASINGFDQTLINLFKDKFMGEAAESVKEADADPFSGYIEGNPRATYFIRMFGQEVGFNDWYVDKADEDFSEGPNIIEIMRKLSKKQEVDMSRNMILANGHFHVSSITGFPVSLVLKAAANLRVAASGRADISKISSMSLDIEASLSPSAAVEVNGEMSFDMGVVKTGLEVSSNIYTSTSGGITVKLVKGKTFDLDINLPQEKQELISVSTNFYLYKSGERQKAEINDNFEEYKKCSPPTIVETLGTIMCTDIKYSTSTDDSPWFPFNGPMSADIYLEKKDTFDSYSISGSLAKAKKPTKPDNIKVFFDTEGSKTPRKVKIIGKLQREQKKMSLSIVAPSFNGDISIQIADSDKEMGIKKLLISYNKKKYVDITAVIGTPQNAVIADFDIDFPQTGIAAVVSHHEFRVNKGIYSMKNDFTSKWLNFNLGGSYKSQGPEYNIDLKYQCEGKQETELMHTFKLDYTNANDMDLDISLSHGHPDGPQDVYFNYKIDTDRQNDKKYQTTSDLVLRIPAVKMNYVTKSVFKRNGNLWSLDVDDTYNGQVTKLNSKMTLITGDPFRANIQLDLEIADIGKLNLAGVIKPTKEDPDLYKMELTANEGTGNEYKLIGAVKYVGPYVFEFNLKTPTVNKPHSFRLAFSKLGDFEMSVHTKFREEYHGVLTFQYSKDGPSRNVIGDLTYGMNEDKWNANVEVQMEKPTFNIKITSNYGMSVTAVMKGTLSAEKPEMFLRADWQDADKPANYVQISSSFDLDGKRFWAASRSLSGVMAIESDGFDKVNFNANFRYTRENENINAYGLVSWSDNEKMEFTLAVDSPGPTEKSISLGISSPFTIQTISIKVIYKLADNKLETNAEVNFDDHRVGISFGGEVSNIEGQFLFKTNAELETSYIGYEQVGADLLINCEARGEDSILHFVDSELNVFWGKTQEEKMHIELNFSQSGHLTGPYTSKRYLKIQIPLEEITDISLEWSLDQLNGGPKKMDFKSEFIAMNKEITLMKAGASVELGDEGGKQSMDGNFKFELEKDLTTLENFDIQISIDTTANGFDGSTLIIWNSDSNIEVKCDVNYEDSENLELNFNLKTPFETFKLLSLKIAASTSSKTVTFKGQAVFDGNDKLSIDGSLAYSLPSITGSLQLITPFKGYKKVKLIPDLNIEAGNYFGTITVELPTKKSVVVYSKYATNGKTDLALRITTPSKKELNVELMFKGKADNFEGYVKFQNVVFDFTNVKTDGNNVKWSVVGERNKKKIIIKGERSYVSTPNEETYTALLTFKHPSTKVDMTLTGTFVNAHDGSKMSGAVDAKYITNAKKGQHKSYSMKMDIYPLLNEIIYNSEMPYGNTDLTGRYRQIEDGHVVQAFGTVGEWPVSAEMKVDGDGLSGIFEYTDEAFGFHTKLMTPYNIENKFYFHKGGNEVTSYTLGATVKSAHILEVYNHCPDDFIPTIKDELIRVKDVVKGKMAIHVKKLKAEMKKKRAIYTKFMKLTYSSPDMVLIKYVGDKTAALRKQMLAEIKNQYTQIKKQATITANTIKKSIKIPFASYSDFMKSMQQRLQTLVNKIVARRENLKSKVQDLLDSSSENSAARYLAHAISDGKEDNLIIALRNLWKETEGEIKDMLSNVDNDFDYIMENIENRYVADTLNNLRSYIKSLVDESDIEKFIKVPFISFVQDLVNRGDESTKTVEKVDEMLQDYFKPEEFHTVMWEPSIGKYSAQMYSPVAFDDFDSIPSQIKSYVMKRVSPMIESYEDMEESFRRLKRDVEYSMSGHSYDLYDVLRQPSGFAHIFENRIVSFDGAEVAINPDSTYTLVSIVNDLGEDFKLVKQGSLGIVMVSGSDILRMKFSHEHGSDDDTHSFMFNDEDDIALPFDEDHSETMHADYVNGVYRMFTHNKNIEVVCKDNETIVKLKSWYHNNVQGALGNFNHEKYDDLVGIDQWETSR